MAKSAGLLDILAKSEYRKNVLFLLLDNPKTLSEIKEFFDVKSPEIIPRLNELEDGGVILKQNGLYSITPFGKVLAKKYKPFLDTIKSMESNKEFWEEHDISIIPEELLNKINKLKDCHVKRLNSCKIDGSHTEFLENTENASSFWGITSVLKQPWVTLFEKLSKFMIPIEIIVTQEIYEEIKLCYSESLEEGLKNPNAHLYISDSPLKIGVSAVCGPGWQFFSMALHTKTGIYDNNNDLQGYDPESFEWGEELFMYYKGKAEEVQRGQVVNKYIYTPEKKVEVVY